MKENMTEVVAWGDLPETAKSPRVGEARGRGLSLAAQAEELKARPFAWARITTRDDEKKAAETARQITAQRLAPFKNGKYEAASVGNEVWARYLGEQ